MKYNKIKGLWIDHKKKDAQWFGESVAYGTACQLYRDINSLFNLTDKMLSEDRISREEYMDLRAFQYRAFESHMKFLKK